MNLIPIILVIFLVVSCGNQIGSDTDHIFEGRKVFIQLGGGPPQSMKSLLAESRSALEKSGLPSVLTHSSPEASQKELAPSDIVFSLSGIPLCEYQARVSPTNQGILVLGKIPPHHEISSDFHEEAPAAEAVLKNIMQRVEEEGLSASLRITHQSSCLILRNKQLIHATITRFNTDHLPYESIADDHDIYTFHPLYLHTTGKGKVYENNILDKTFKTYDLKDLDDSGKLNSPHLRSAIFQGFAEKRAYSKNFLFDFSDNPKSPEFQEVSVYTNAERTFRWFEKIGYQFSDELPIRIVPGAIINNDVNNAMYLPKNGGDDPTIYIGTGDGKILQNLTTDGDVVSHEFSHHVVYNRIKDWNNPENRDPLIIHEGMADLFTFTRTQNACLGESICPDSSKMCAIKGKCLRSAENTYKLSDKEKLVEPHLQGQIISGLLWDLGAYGFTDDQIAQISLAALDRVPESASFKDLSLALVAADQASFNGEFCGALRGTFEKRGFDEYVEPFNCPVAKIVGRQDETAAATSETEKESSEKQTETCTEKSKSKSDKTTTLIDESSASCDSKNTKSSSSRSTRTESNSPCGTITGHSHLGALQFLLLTLPLGVIFRRKP